MGTPNFHNQNASRIFATCMNTEEKFSECSECEAKHYEWESDYVTEGNKNCPECEGEDCIEHDEESRSAEDFEWADMKENIATELARIATTIGASHCDGGEDQHELRSFPSTVLGRLYAEKEYKGFSVGVTLTAVARSGYYEGANLDWNIEYEFDLPRHRNDLPR